MTTTCVPGRTSAFTPSMIDSSESHTRVGFGACATVAARSQPRFGGAYQNPKNQLFTFAVAPNYLDLYPEVEVAQAERDVVADRHRVEER